MSYAVKYTDSNGQIRAGTGFQVGKQKVPVLHRSHDQLVATEHSAHVSAGAQAHGYTVPAKIPDAQCPDALRCYPRIGVTDYDLDGILDETDNCPFDPNFQQGDSNGNGVGNACE